MAQPRFKIATNVGRHDPSAAAARPTPFPTAASAERDGGAALQARALQRRLVHAFEHGEPELPEVARYSGAIRLTLLVGAAASLWWSIYTLAQLAFA